MNPVPNRPRIGARARRRWIAALALIIAATSVGAQQAAGNRDLSGHWDRTTRVVSFGAVPQARGQTGEEAPLTPYGRTLLESNKPGYGPRSSEERNDPMVFCTPPGVVRNLTTEIVAPHDTFEIVQLPNRILQFFEYNHDWREIWMDGRTLPSLDEAELKWNGYSVGHWEGDTLVVDSVGFNDRTWLDKFGYPHTEEMRVEERYRRVDADTLELVITITDPKVYSRPWQSDRKMFRLDRDRADGWDEQIYCVPADAFELNDLIRYNRQP